MTLYQLQSPPTVDHPDEPAELRLWMDYWPRYEERRGEYIRHGDFFLLIQGGWDASICWSLRLQRRVLISHTSIMTLDRVG